MTVTDEASWLKLTSKSGPEYTRAVSVFFFCFLFFCVCFFFFFFERVHYSQGPFLLEPIYMQ